MSVSSLQARASEEVAYCILEGKTKVLTKLLDPSMSNEVFEKLTKFFGHPDSEMIDMMMNHIRPSIINLSGFKLQEFMIPYLNKLSLKSLKLGEYTDLTAAYTKNDPNSKGAIIDIVKLLKDILNENSRTQLKILELTSHINELNFQFKKNWARPIGTLIPNLTVLKISNKRLSSVDFKNITNFFPNLEELDITKTMLDSLKGISKLKNLKSLSMGENYIEDEKSMKDLYSCTKLEYLSFANSRDWNRDYGLIIFIEFGKKLPNLKYLNLVYSSVDDEELKSIVERQPSLKTIAANSSYIEIGEFPGITLYSDHSAENSLASLTHFREKADRYCLLKVLTTISNGFMMTYINGEPVDHSINARILVELDQILKIYENDSDFIKLVYNCYGHMLPDNDQYRNNEQIMIIKGLLKVSAFYRNPQCKGAFTFSYFLWSGIRHAMNSIQNLNLDEICAEAMEWICIKNRKGDGKCDALAILKSSLTKINKHSTHYKYVDMKRLCLCLRNMQKAKLLSDDEKLSARTILRFVQDNFM